MPRFGFGNNWRRFIERHYTEERIRSAQENLLNGLLRPNLDGLTFLDIGSGSGLHSLAAWRSGAKKVISFDYDVNSVETTKKLWEMAGSPKNWTVMRGDVLDADFMRQFEDVDIVYSWGVLHHTGNMYQAIENAAIPLENRESGVFFIALYSYNAYQSISSPGPEYWLNVKKRYNESGILTKRYLELQYIWNTYFNAQGLRGKIEGFKKLQYVRNTMHRRGMEWMTDVRDWVGGWPMEFVKEDELAVFCKEKLHLHLVRLLTGRGNTEFIFSQGHTWLDPILENRVHREVPRPFKAQGNAAWGAPLPLDTGIADTVEAPRGSTLLVWEDGKPLAYPHARQPDIKTYGHGRYTHFKFNVLNKTRRIFLFSTSDNSDPNTNGRKYTFTVDDPNMLAELRHKGTYDKEAGAGPQAR